MTKRIIMLIITILSVFSLTGCWNSVEIEKMDIVSGIAIDKGKDGYKYNLAAEIIDLDEKAEKPARIIEISANTILDATRQLISTSSRKLYYGHCKIAIISEEVAREGIIPSIDILMRFLTSRISLDILISKNVEAKEILSQQTVRKSPAGFEINTLVENDQKNLSNSKKTELYTLVNELVTEGVCPTLPAIGIEKIKDKSFYRLDGIAAFSKDKLVGFINRDEAKYFLFITDNIQDGPLSVKVNNDKNLFISTEISKNKTGKKFNVKDNRLSIDINTTTSVNIGEIGSRNEFLDDKEHNKLKSLLEDQIENNIQDIISNSQDEFGCDIFGFGEILHQTNPKLWNKYKKNWNETFKNIKVNVKSEVKIINEGSIHKEITGEV